MNTMNYIAAAIIYTSVSAFALFSFPVLAIDTHRGGCRDNRFNGCGEEYTPPNNGHPDCDPYLGSGTRLY
jgi:hypothetical protein